MRRVANCYTPFTLLLLSLRAGVTESGGAEAQKAQLVKELRAATQKAKSELGNSRPTSAAKRRQAASNSQRWTSTDDDYLPDRPQARPDLHSMDSDADKYSSSRQRRLSGSEDGYGRTHSSRDSGDDDDDDDDDDDGGGDEFLRHSRCV